MHENRSWWGKWHESWWRSPINIANVERLPPWLEKTAFNLKRLKKSLAEFSKRRWRTNVTWAFEILIFICRQSITLMTPLSKQWRNISFNIMSGGKVNGIMLFGILWFHGRWYGDLSKVFTVSDISATSLRRKPKYHEKHRWYKINGITLISNLVNRLQSVPKLECAISFSKRRGDQWRDES